MPKRTDIHKILIIGSGPIVIGQACEFDYSGTQACRALKSLGYEIILINSNPATVMTDPEMADRTYLEPLDAKRLEQVIEKERPDALLPNLGGQTGLNLCAELAKNGILEKYGIQVIGADAEAIERGENRIAFKKTMEELGIGMAKSEVAYSVDEALKIADSLGYPVVVRPAYTMGGTGGGLVYNRDELRTVADRGIGASLIHQILVEESVLGWEELELEVLRDSADNMVTACFIENVDPCGIHTGDSFCTAPMLTVPAEVQAELERQAFRIVRKIGVVGGTNVQFARDPETGRVIVIEINPRASRSSALASKATGFPITYISAQLACGVLLSEIPCGKCGTLDKYVPEHDHVAVKFARWAFETYQDVEDKLGTQMRAVGEVMALGRNFREAFQKAVRSLDNGRSGLGHAKNFAAKTKEELLRLLVQPSSERYFQIYEAFRKGASVEEVQAVTRVNEYFLAEIRELALEEETLVSRYYGTVPANSVYADADLIQAKKDGFSDQYLAEILNVPEGEIRKRREELDLVEKYAQVRVSGTEDGTYYYSSYIGTDEVAVAADSRQKILILGGGPNRIGEGSEYDYASVHAAKALKKLGFLTILVNCNPETVSTDFDTADRLYFEPLTLEDVLGICRKEKPAGVIAQFGGTTAVRLAEELEKEGVPVLGTRPEENDQAADPAGFRGLMEKLGIPVPDKLMDSAMECEADAVSDGENVYIPAVNEHIELAGIHAGDSACLIPSKHIPEGNLRTIREYTKKIAGAMGIIGLLNVRFAIEDGRVYVLEVNPGASRTVPLTSKVCGIDLAAVAVDVITSAMTFRPSPVSKLLPRFIPYYGVKEAVFPFAMFPEVDPLLGSEMRSTGEVMGIAAASGEAFYKAEEAAGSTLPLSGTVLISLNEQDKPEAAVLARMFAEDGFRILATGRTYQVITSAGVSAEKVLKIYEGGRPNILDLIINGRIDLIVNTPEGETGHHDDSYLRKGAIRAGVPYITTVTAARAAAEGIHQMLRSGDSGILPLQEWHEKIETEGS
ncbi:carbamoyl-phosphate synthase large subunit [Clostridium vitabionis]|uniref:carbamoyl-phosphate synthase large subunit n=1 Tax=Clostridium vitabionis TaxID=2784388 RepID=UPI00188B23A0|nr:carbamoyl-phosphate synthase large subunit [Clostridium vitabionis]